MAKHRYFIRLSFDGTNYFGWQIQKGQVSVQSVLTESLRLLTGSKSMTITGCCRTDTGVHALDFCAHFDLPGEMVQKDCDDLAFRLNRFLHKDIVIHRIYPVPHEMHARHSPVSRTYEYYIHIQKDAFLDRYSVYFFTEFDIDLMNEGCRVIMEYEDFTSFSKLHSAAKTNICKISKAEWIRNGHELKFIITADRFLRNMVRAIVGTLMDLGQHKITLEELRAIIEGKNRSLAGQSVPAKGLFLAKVVYPGE